MSKNSPLSGEPEGAYYTDHPRLCEEGNIRLRYAINPVNQWLEILEEDHYYPFGLKHKGYNAENYVFMAITEGPVELVPTSPNVLETYKYKFNGMEWQSEMGLDFYDFGARNYDPALGRWMNIDPLAEVSRRWSPYTYAYNNPLRFIDPDGMEPFDTTEEEKEEEEPEQYNDNRIAIEEDLKIVDQINKDFEEYLKSLRESEEEDQESEEWKLAKSIQFMYGGNAKEYYDFLVDHPIVVVYEDGVKYVTFEGLIKSTNTVVYILEDGTYSFDPKIEERLVKQGYKQLFKRLFKGGNFLLVDGKLANHPSPLEIKEKEKRELNAKDLLIQRFFEQHGGYRVFYARKLYVKK